MAEPKFYLDRLYPLQDKTLRAIDALDSHSFYLTGGTALSRAYYSHRYSDDLDLFTTAEIPDFRREAGRVLSCLERAGLSIEVATASEHFCRFFASEGETALRVDLVNDTLFHYGELAQFPFFSRVDNELNILSNKITAVSRHEAKDMADDRLSLSLQLAGCPANGL